MAQFKYQIQIQAPGEPEAESKMRSLTTLAKHLTQFELERLAEIITHDPIKTAMAKKALLAK